MLTVWILEYEPEKISEADVSRLAGMISPGRRDKIASVKHPGKRLSSVLATRLLELNLSRMLGVDPLDLSYVYEQNGKPRLVLDTCLPFSISHSDGCVCAAINHGTGASLPCGVDCETVSASVAKASSLLKIAEKHFSEKEKEIILGAGGTEDSVKAFLKFWTSREAHAKMTGNGIYGEISSKDLTVTGSGGILFGDGSFTDTVFTGSSVISFSLPEDCRKDPAVFAKAAPEDLF